MVGMMEGDWFIHLSLYGVACPTLSLPGSWNYYGKHKSLNIPPHETIGASQIAPYYLYSAPLLTRFPQRYGQKQCTTKGKGVILVAHSMMSYHTVFFFPIAHMPSDPGIHAANTLFIQHAWPVHYTIYKRIISVQHTVEEYPGIN